MEQEPVERSITNRHAATGEASVEVDLGIGDASTRRAPVAALLLSGGASRRMGRDKTQLVHEGLSLARRTAQLLREVVDVALEIGPGRSGLESIQEEPRGEGPLSAIVAGRHALAQRGHDGSVLVVACDMPLLSQRFLDFLVRFDTSATVVPVVEGRLQPLCAKWGLADLEAAGDRHALGERSLRFLATSPHVVLLDQPQWAAHATIETFTDVDTPDDARRLGLNL